MLCNNMMQGRREAHVNLRPLTCAVRSLVCSFCRLHTPSRLAKPSVAMRILGRMRTSNPLMLNRRFGLSRLYTLTKLLSHSSVVSDLQGE